MESNITSLRDGVGRVGGTDDAPKYAVFKWDDWAHYLETHPEWEVNPLPEPIGGSHFTIRDQDVFGAQALFGYAHIIQTGLELDALPGRSVFTVEEREHLAATVDRLSSLAQHWQRHTNKKIPD
jgi:hypothetical protein